MIVGTADLLRRRGINATSIREVVKHTGTPRGSIAHHFPEGKRQLLQAALTFAGDEVSVPLASLLQQHGAVGGLERFIRGWRDLLQQSEYQAGCAVLAVAVEQLSDADNSEEHAAQQALLDQADSIFTHWRALISNALQTEGISIAEADAQALLVIASIEGSVALCRAGRSCAPLDALWHTLQIQLEHALPN